MTIVTKNNMPSTKDKFRSFFMSEVTVFSPNMYGKSSAVARRSMELIARRMLRSCITKGGNDILCFFHLIF